MEQTPNRSDVMILLPSYYDNDIFSRKITIQKLAPRERFYSRIPLIVPGKGLDLRVKVMGDRYQEVKFKNYEEKEIENHSFRAFQIFLIGGLMLPPWANGLIPALVSFVCYLAELGINDGKKEADRLENLRMLGRILGRTVVYLFACFVLLLVLVI